MNESSTYYEFNRKLNIQEAIQHLEELAVKMTGQTDLTPIPQPTRENDMSYYLVYDLEIVKAIPDRKYPNLCGIEYCEGWSDHANMGISVICTYDAYEDRFRVFCGDNFHEFQQMLELRYPLVTFNGINFDDKVLKENGIIVPGGKSIDLLREIWKAAGLGPEYQYPTHAGYSLDAICKANGLKSKTGNGTKAPVDWQQGKIGSVIDYCLNDVTITRNLYRLIVNPGFLIDPKTHKELEIRL
jgi:hypothetical protein